MRQVLTIFGKDLRRLWPIVLIVWGMIAAHAVFEFRSAAALDVTRLNMNSMAGVLNVILPIGFWALTAQLIHEEALPGDRQFWLTRPYSRWKLLAAKLLFLVVYLMLPLLVSDCYLLGVHGFAVLGVWQRLLLRQLLAGCLLLLPPFAVAAITTSTTQVLLAAFLGVLAMITESMLLPHRASFSVGVVSAPVLFCAMSVVLGGVVVWQYTQRRTVAARLFLLAALFAFFPGVGVISHLIGRFRPPAALPTSLAGMNLQVNYDLGRAAPRLGDSTRKPSDDEAIVRLPMRVTELPATTFLRGTGLAEMRIGGHTWPSSGYRRVGEVQHAGDEYWQAFTIKRSELAQLSKARVDFHSDFRLEVITETQEAAQLLANHLLSVPSLGLCLQTNSSIECYAGLEPRVETAVMMRASSSSTILLGVARPVEIPWGLSPVTRTINARLPGSPPDRKLTFVQNRSIGTFQRLLTLKDVELTRYVVANDEGGVRATGDR